MTDRIISLLKGNNLRLTEPRGKILSLFIDKPHALSQSDIDKLVENDSIDRVTVYRTLKTFVSSGILHAIPDLDGQIKYALCEEHCYHEGQHDHHTHNHLHFTCQQCGNMVCLDHHPIPQIQLPPQYKIVETSVVLKGLCPNCQH